MLLAEQERSRHDVVFVAYNPVASSQDRVSARSNALSHAARVSHRYRVPKSPKHTSTKRRGRAQSNSERRCSKEEYYWAATRGLGCIQHGNSDPFDTMAVPITAEVTSLLSMWRLHVRSNRVPTSQWVSDAEVKSDFSLGEEFHTKALLFACSALLATRHDQRRDLLVKTLEYKQSCLQYLTTRAISQSGQDIRSAVRALSLVFIAACLFNEIQEARLHALHLQRLLAEFRSSETYDAEEEIRIQCRIHHYDCQNALAQMRPLILPFAEVTRYWEDYLAPTREWMSTRTPKAGVVKHPRFSKGLEGIFTRFQSHIDIQCEGIPVISRKTSGHCLSATLGNCIALTEELFEQLRICEQELLTAGDCPTRRKWQTEVLLCTCAIALLACTEHGPVIDSTQSGKKAMRSLRKELEATQALDYRLDSGPHGHAQLWAMYLGATWECEWEERRSDQEAWFSPRLQLMVQELGISSWEELKQIADGFLRVPSTMEEGAAICFLGMRSPESGQRSYKTQAQSLQDVIDYRI